MTHGPLIDGMMERDRAVFNAAAFIEKHQPIAEADYGWVFELAKARLASEEAAFKAFDDKAHTIITYLGTGTGLFVLGILGAASAGQLSGLALYATIPSVVASAAAIVLAILARMPAVTFYPGIPHLAWAVQKSKEEKQAKGWLLGYYELAVKVWANRVREKSFWYSKSAWSTAFSISLLVLPIVAKGCDWDGKKPAMNAHELSPANPTISVTLKP